MNTQPTIRSRIALVLAVLAAALAGCGSADEAAVDAEATTTTTTVPAPTTSSATDPTTTTTPPTTTTTIKSSTATAPSATNSAAAPPPAPMQAARIKTFMFMPSPLRIPAGTTVTWTNEDQIRHTVTSARRTYDERGMQKEILPGPPGFDFELDGRGSTASFTFDDKGSFPYVCTIHPGMDSEVIVE